MTSNHKLTALLKGRTVQAVAHDGTTLSMTFTDGSVMTVQTGETAATPAATTTDGGGGTAGAVVDAVRQQDTTLLLVFADNSQMPITTAEATSSVLVRDHAHVLEYAD